MWTFGLEQIRHLCKKPKLNQYILNKREIQKSSKQKIKQIQKRKNLN